MQKFEAIGNLTSEPETKYTQSGKGVCTFGIAINEKRGETQQTTFVRVSAFEKRGEIIQQYSHKGDKMYVSGRIGSHAYMGSDGKPRASLELILNDFEFLGSKQEHDTGKQAQTGNYSTQQDMMVVEDETLPF